MSKVLYVKVKIDGYLEAQPTAENLMLPGGYALSHSGILLPKYSPVAGYAVMPDDETDFAQLSVLTVQSTRPQGYESEVLASGYVTQLAWYQVTVPDNYTYNGDGGGGGQPLPPVPHKEDFYSYQGDRWTTGFSDSKGIWHEYPDIPGRPGWQAFWTVADQPALRAMAAVLEGANGLTNEQRSAIFFGVAELAGLQSSVSSAKAIPAAQLKFDALHAAAFHLVDVITSPSGIYDNERAWLQAGNAFWKAQKAIETSLSSSLAAYYKSHVGTAIDGAVLKQTLAVLSSQSVSAFHLSSNDDVIVSYGNNALEPWLHVGPDQSASDFFFDLNPADQFFNIAGSSETSIYKGIVFGSIRNDSITLSTLTGMHVYAGPGSDAVLNYAASGTIDLGDGNDVIYSSGTFGVLRGGKGFDQLLLATDFGVSIDLSSKSMTFNYTMRRIFCLPR
ncbi:MAG: hypothetical protein U1E15_07750 [Hyphomicrobiales bacterium]